MISANTRRMMDQWRVRNTLRILTYKELEQTHNAAMKIQKVWRRCVSNPAYCMCRRRLLREFHELEFKV